MFHRAAIDAIAVREIVRERGRFPVRGRVVTVTEVAQAIGLSYLDTRLILSCLFLDKLVVFGHDGEGVWLTDAAIAHIEPRLQFKIRMGIEHTERGL